MSRCYNLVYSWTIPNISENTDEGSASRRNGELNKTDEKVIMFIHGGGYISMSTKTHRDLIHKVSKVTGRRVFAFDYRLSPETRFPGALYDTVQAYLYLIDTGMDPKNITLIGDSAGGGLCLALPFYLRDHGFPLPEGIVLFSPWVDLTFTYPSWKYNACYDYLPTDISSWDKNPAILYLGAENHAQLCRHPYVSPLYAENFEGLPPILIQYGGGETLRDEIVELARKVKGSRTTVVQVEEYEDMPHVFQLLPLDKSQQAIANVGRFVSALQRSPSPE
ncbi:Alpha/Beta hydrolase protein [Fennellomyces sp. T-0311]|nr:Alpha/Beta hydrolase protein [Fennellomyces sp. T-0311]